MKKIGYFTIVVISFFSGCKKEDPRVIVDIPDTDFLQALIELGVDTDGDSFISYREAAALTTLKLPERNGIRDMTGIEAFINLDTLNCRYSPYLQRLDVTGNTRLKYLNLYNSNRRGSHLSFLNVSNNPLLEYLDCSFNYLSNLDLSKSTNLKYLNIWRNQFSTLDVSGNTALSELYCGTNQLSALDVSSNTALTKLYCDGNPLYALDVSKNISLSELYCGGFHLTALDVSNNPALTKLDCSHNPIDSLDVSNNTALTFLAVVDIPTLNRICVWTMPFPPEGVTVYADNSPNAYFTTDCGR
jgi:Leucine-rich repeat (LRR) protein